MGSLGLEGGTSVNSPGKTDVWRRRQLADLQAADSPALPPAFFDDGVVHMEESERVLFRDAFVWSPACCSV